MKQRIDTQEHPICPKCGYDQSGEIATWEDQCPLDGRCPECGLEFVWADVFDPSRVDLRWYVEHAKWPWGVIWRTIPTLKKLIIPHIYWREVGVDTRIRFSFLVIWLLMLTSIMHVLVAVPVGMGGWRDQGNWGSGLSIRAYIERHGVRVVPEEMFNAVALPFAHFDYGGGSHQFAWGSFGEGQVIGVLAVAGSFIGLASIWPIMLVVLPVSRSRIQLRKAHLLRSWMVTLFVILFNVQMVRAMIGIANWLNGSANPALFSSVFLVVTISSVIWIQWFWIAALKVGWGIRPVWLIGLLGVIASVLAGVAPILYLIVYMFQNP